tara:strand:- start:654 stop:779 length:126 start_codon:yes stop_codon:yes gene_type:complete
MAGGRLARERIDQCCRQQIASICPAASRHFGGGERQQLMVR